MISNLLALILLSSACRKAECFGLCLFQLHVCHKENATLQQEGGLMKKSKQASVKISPKIATFAHVFSTPRHPELAAVCRDDRTLILYPGPKSQNLEELVQCQEVATVKHNVIIIDGTWSQAKNMFLKNSMFHLPKQVC